MFDKWKSRRHNGAATESHLSVVAMIASPDDAARLSEIVANTEWEFQAVRDLEEAAALVQARPASVVIFDRDFPGTDWKPAIGRLAKGHCRVILASYVADDYLWEEVIHCGGYDILAKPFRDDEVLHMIRFASAALTRSLPCAPRTK